MDNYIVYIRTDAAGRIIEINSSAFLQDTTGWVQIDAGEGDRYHHAQGNYLPEPVTDENGVYRYQLSGGVPVKRTAEEMAADMPTSAPPSEAERIDALEAAVLTLMEVSNHG